MRNYIVLIGLILIMSPTLLWGQRYAKVEETYYQSFYMDFGYNTAPELMLFGMEDAFGNVITTKEDSTFSLDNFEVTFKGKVVDEESLEGLEISYIKDEEEFKVHPSKINTDGAYEFSIQLEHGDNPIKIMAKDGQLATSNQLNLNFMVVNKAPELFISDVYTKTTTQERGFKKIEKDKEYDETEELVYVVAEKEVRVEGTIYDDLGLEGVKLFYERDSDEALEITDSMNIAGNFGVVLSLYGGENNFTFFAQEQAEQQSAKINVKVIYQEGGAVEESMPAILTASQKLRIKSRFRGYQKLVDEMLLGSDEALVTMEDIFEKEPKYAMVYDDINLKEDNELNVMSFWTHIKLESNKGTNIDIEFLEDEGDLDVRVLRMENNNPVMRFSTNNDDPDTLEDGQVFWTIVPLKKRVTVGEETVEKTTYMYLNSQGKITQIQQELHPYAARIK